MSNWNRDDEREVEVVTGCFMMVRREACLEVGTMDEAFFFFGEETDWCLRFKQAGWKVKFAPVGEIVHLGGASFQELCQTRLNAESGTRSIPSQTLRRVLCSRGLGDPLGF